MDDLLWTVGEHVARLIEAIAILVVAFGALQALAGTVGFVARGRRARHADAKLVWRRFGMWLVLGLEFMLAADIVRTAITPSWEDIGRLGAIAAVRTFLNYFLEKDLERTASTAE